MNKFIKIHKNSEFTISLIVLALAIISILMIGSTTISTNFFSRSVIIQSVSYLLGVLSIYIFMKFNYHIFKDSTKELYIISIILLLLVYIPGLGKEQFGARSWINLGVTTIQPSEIVKILFIIILANYFNTHRDELYNLKCLLKAAFVSAPIIIIVLKEDLGSALVFSSIWLAMLFFSGINYKAFLQFLGIFALTIPLSYIFMAAYQKERIEAFLHPENLSLSGNYQVWQSKVAIGSGGFFGKGLFQGTQKELKFIPVQTSDFIFSVIGEELGFIGGLFVIGIITILLLKMMKILQSSLDFYGSLIIAGVIGMFTFQIFENIAMTMGIMPVTGITLPFLSYGGSSILSNMMALGLVFNVASRSKRQNFM